MQDKLLPLLTSKYKRPGKPGLFPAGEVPVLYFRTFEWGVRSLRSQPCCAGKFNPQVGFSCSLFSHVRMIGYIMVSLVF